MCVQSSSCVFVLRAQRQQQLWTSEVVLLVRQTRTQWSHSWTLHGLTLFVVFLIYGTFVTNQAAAVKPQLLKCGKLWLFPENKKQQQNFLTTFEPLNMSAAATPQMAGREAWEGQLFNPLRCKHDLFELRGICQDILVWADLPKQPWHCVCPSETNL